MASPSSKQDDAWQTVLADELMEKTTITPRTLSILKDAHEYCDPNILMNLRHKSAKLMAHKKRESASAVIEVAKRNLKTEHKNKASAATTKKFIDSELEKFKQHLTYLKRINASSNRPPLARKSSLRVRFQKIAIRSRSCGPNVVKVRRNKTPEFGSLDNDLLSLPETKNVFYNLPPPTKLNWDTGSPSLESLESDMSLPAVYGNSLCGTVEISQRGPNTTPISLSSGISLSKAQHIEQVRSSQGKGIAFTAFYEEDCTSQSAEPYTDLSNTELPYYCVEYSAKLNDENAGSHQHEEVTPVPVNDLLDTIKTRPEKKRKVKNSVYKQFMTYVCSKTTRVKQLQNNPSDKVLPLEDLDRAAQREEKIALVLDYLQRKKNSPETSQSVTSPELVQKSKEAVLTVLVDPKTARASGGPYGNRFQAQRDIIKRQKMQLEEQQKKIEELTLVKLQEEAKNSQRDFQKCIDELEENCTLSIRPQLKNLKATGSQPNFSAAGKIVERMEQRAKEREEKRQLAAERKKHLEEERKKKMAEEEEKHRKEEEEKKREAYEKMRDEKVRQREIRERVRKEQERMLNLERRAEAYNKVRLCKTAFRAFKKLLVIRDGFEERAYQFYSTKILKTAFLAWKECVKYKTEKRLAAADSFYNKLLLRNSFHSWKKELVNNIRRTQVADDMYEMRLLERIFRQWSKYVNEQHLKMEEKLEMADQRYSRMILRKAFFLWRVYPKIAHLERVKEQRKTVLRQLVKDMLPDFRPTSPQY